MSNRTKTFRFFRTVFVRTKRVNSYCAMHAVVNGIIGNTNAMRSSGFIKVLLVRVSDIRE